MGALGQPDELDRDAVGRRDHQRARVGVADVLGGQDHHPPHDEARVLAALEHHREVVQRGVDVAGARRLDPRGDQVVVLVAGAVVAHGLALQRALGAGQATRAARARAVSAASSSAPSALRASPPLRWARNATASSSTVDVAQLAALDRAAQQRLDVLGGQRAQLQHLRPRQQRGVDREVRVLGRRADQRDQALLDRRQQRVLLGLVEAVDLVEEQDRRRARRAGARGRAR